MPLVSSSIPANFITLISNVFVYCSLALAVAYPEKPTWVFFCIAVMLLIYVVGDHMDGMQAKRTQTSSPLGEFCDHFLDAFNNGLVLILLFLLYDIPISLMVLVLSASYLALNIRSWSETPAGRRASGSA
jgi:ethanolaminephosphotransferase